MSATPNFQHGNASTPGRKQRPRYSQVNWVAVVASVFVLLLILRIIQVQMDLAAAGKSYPPAYWALQFGNGLVLGGVYALIALGYTLVYGILLMINFAHGEIVMFGAYAGFFVLAACDATGFSKSNQVATLLVVFGAGMLVSMVMGVGLERIAYRPLRAAPRLVPLITAIGASVFLQETARLIFGAPIRVYNKPPMLQGAYMLPGNIPVPITGVFIIGSSIVLMVVLYWLVNHTKTGRAMRAVATNKEAAALMGISVDRLIVITFAIGSILAGAAGVMLGFHNSQINSTMGFFPGIKAFTAAVLGGIGNIPGAMLGGLILGLAEALGPSLLGIPSQYKDVIAFTLLVLVLIFRPQGILGEQLGAEKA